MNRAFATGTIWLPGVSPAYASYQDGALGVFVLLYSVPVVLVAGIFTAIFWARRRFESKAFVTVYCTLLGAPAAAFMLLVLLVTDDVASAFWLVLGMPILLAPVVVPAVLQYRHRPYQADSGGPFGPRRRG